MPTRRIKIRASSLPPGDGDGLTYYASKFIDEPKEMRLVLALIDTRQVVHDEDNGDQTAIVRLRRIEVVDDKEDARELKRIMLRANERRKGGTVLPLAMEDELESVFQDFQAAAVDEDEPPTDDDAEGT